VKELVFHRQMLPAVEQFADKVGYLDGDYEATHAQHFERVCRLTAALRSLGVGRQDRFAVMALNCHQYMELWHAAFLGAGTINPLNLRLAAPELAYILRDSGTKVVFTDFLFGGIVDQIREEAGIEKVVLIGEGDIAYDANYDELLASMDPALPDEPDEDDPTVLMYTGGTTGLPKGVLHSQRSQMLNLYHVAMTWPLDEHMVNLNQTPMFHAATLGGILGVPTLGATSTFVPLFDPVRVMETIEATGTTFTVMVPTLVGMVLDHPEFRPERLSSLQILTYGASPMPTATLQRLIDMYPDLDLFQGYGMTEASAVVTVLGPDDHRQGGVLLGSAGRPPRGVSVSIRDEDGAALPQGENGEVCVRAGNLMVEYWNKPEATEEVFREGWYHTGDAGYVDEDGYLYLVDRVKDMIVTGGENVYSIEVENAISTHPAVEQVAVIGIPSDKWGEAVHAIVVLREGAEAGEDDIIAHARDSIAGYKVPKSVEFRDEPLPLSGALKVLKRDLRRPYWEGQDRSVG
jgi:long-chain acyl-CoA synthetase